MRAPGPSRASFSGLIKPHYDRAGRPFFCFADHGYHWLQVLWWRWQYCCSSAPGRWSPAAVWVQVSPLAGGAAIYLEAAPAECPVAQCSGARHCPRHHGGGRNGRAICSSSACRLEASMQHICAVGSGTPAQAGNAQGHKHWVPEFRRRCPAAGRASRRRRICRGWSPGDRGVHDLLMRAAVGDKIGYRPHADAVVRHHQRPPSAKRSAVRIRPASINPSTRV